MSDRGRETLVRSALIVLASAGLIVAVFPLGWALLTALKSRPLFERSPWGLPDFQWSNFAKVFTTVPFARFYLNSLLISLVSVAFATAFGAAAGYALARLRFRGASFLLGVFLLGLMIPVHVTLVPLHRLSAGVLQLQGHTISLLGPYVAFALPISIYIFRGFFLQLPRELDEAALLDGAEPIDRFLWVALPVARPAVATVVVLNFVNMWNEYAFALTLVQGEANQTLPLGLDRFSHEHSDDLTLVCAAILMGVVPVLALYVSCQRHVIAGLTAGTLR